MLILLPIPYTSPPLRTPPPYHLRTSFSSSASPNFASAITKKKATADSCLRGLFVLGAPNAKKRNRDEKTTESHHAGRTLRRAKSEGRKRSGDEVQHRVAGVGRQVRRHVRGSHAGAAGLVQVLCGRAGVCRPPLPDARVQRADVSGHLGGGPY